MPMQTGCDVTYTDNPNSVFPELLHRNLKQFPVFERTCFGTVVCNRVTLRGTINYPGYLRSTEYIKYDRDIIRVPEDCYPLQTETGSVQGWSSCDYMKHNISEVEV